ncbi:MAG: hypothetical protein IT434_14750 [Phycisphaerales bacterium]|nr:hypothetical protein [Phycisphaerales bacterium]
MAQDCQPGWLPGDGVPGTDGEVNASVMWDPDGDGPLGPRLVIGGTFSLVEKTRARSIAMWNPDTGTWSTFGDGLSDNNGPGVRALFVHSDGRLIAGGALDPGDVAVWDGISWAALGGQHLRSVTALAELPDGDILAGGSGGVVGPYHSGIAVFDGTQWRPFGDQGTDPEHFTSVMSLAVQLSGDVYVGGLFSQIGDVPARSIARWDGSAWHPLGDGVTNDYGNYCSVDTLTFLADHSLIAGGDFSIAGGVIAPGLARWDGVAWSRPGNLKAHHIHHTEALADGRLMVCGEIEAPNSARNWAIAFWDGSAWTGIDAGILATNGFCSSEIPGGEFFLGGSFSGVATTVATNIARWRPAAGWNTFGRGILGIRALATLPDGSLVAGGNLQAAYSTSFATGVARFDGSHWLDLNCPGRGISAMTPRPNGNLVVTELSSPHVFEWDTSSWQQLGTAFNWDTNSITATQNGDIVIGGNFSSHGDQEMQSVAHWDGSAWHPMGDGFPSSYHSEGVLALAALSDGSIVAGGNFINPGVGRSALMRWDGSGWALLGPDTFGSARALLTLPNGNLIAAGSFDGPPDGPGRSVVLWDGTVLLDMGDGLDGNVYALARLPNGYIVAGGKFNYSGDTPTENLAVWDGEVWKPVGQGVQGIVYALAIDGSGDLSVAGDFVTIGGQVSANFARYRFCDCPADFNHDGSVNTADFEAFTNAFAAAEPGADFNHDAFINADDYDFFAERFDQGC